MDQVTPFHENSDSFEDPLRGESIPLASEVSVPPKPGLEEPEKKNVWLRSFTSLALYLALGYWFFQSITTLLIITAVVVVHEMGHFLAMKYYNYKDLGIFFIPLLGAYATGTKHEISQKQSAVIILAGPLPGIIIGIILYIISSIQPHYLLAEIAGWAIFLNILNLIPVYPLDGGQLLNRVFLNENNTIGRIFVFLSAAAMIWFALQFYPNPFFYILLIFPLMLLFRMGGDIRYEKLIRRIESEGVTLDSSYEDLSDENYWKIRNALVRHHPSLAGIPPAPPYQFHEKEDQVILTMQAVLQRSLVMDIPIAGKLLIFLIWAGSFALPFVLELSFPFFNLRG